MHVCMSDVINELLPFKALAGSASIHVKANLSLQAPKSLLTPTKRSKVGPFSFETELGIRAGRGSRGVYNPSPVCPTC